MKKKIRLGVLRCDTHAYWYAPLFAKCDCDLLRLNDTAVYNIFCSLNDPYKLDIPWVPGFEITSCWDEDPETAQQFSATFLGTAEVACSPAAMADKKKIDAAFIADGVEWVQAMGDVPLHESASKQLNAGGLPDFKGKRVPLNYIHMQYANGKQGLVINGPLDLFPDRCDFHATAHSKQGTLHSPQIGDPEFMEGGAIILKLFRKMVQTGKPVIAYDSLLEKIAIVDAALLSQKRGKAVRMREIL